MTAPTYRLFLYRPEPIRVGLCRWAWMVGDGYLIVLAEGATPTRWGARRARDRFAGQCRSVAEAAELELKAALAEVVEQLHADGIDVVAELDERGRVCVRPLCACSTRDEVRVLAAFLAITSAVRWSGVA